MGRRIGFLRLGHELRTMLRKVRGIGVGEWEFLSFNCCFGFDRQRKGIKQAKSRKFSASFGGNTITFS